MLVSSNNHFNFYCGHNFVTRNPVTYGRHVSETSRILFALKVKIDICCKFYDFLDAKFCENY